jgi:serine/threonine-protein kinase LATS1/2
MLISPNLRTLFDKKKQPPPPYPGKKMQITSSAANINSENGQHEMDIEESEYEVEKSNELIEMKSLSEVTSSSTSSIQSATASQSVVRYCSPQAYKFFMEQHAENILKHHKAREYRRFQLENEMTKVDLTPSLKEQMRKLLRQKETNYLRLRRAKMNKSMFEHIKVLGLGAFGEVNLVRKRDDMQRLYAMKILHKSDVFNRNQAAHVKAERDILAEADNEWVVKLYYSFQDEENLYFVMDYVPGGDLMNLLIKLQIFSEELSQFYIGELTCAIESVHNLGFIHRDIKPDNILIDKYGHIKLTDFGLCTGFHWTHNSKYYRTGKLT